MILWSSLSLSAILLFSLLCTSSTPQLAHRVAFHEHLLPVCLPPPNIKNLRPEQLCTVIGWGKREDKDRK